MGVQVSPNGDRSYNTDKSSRRNAYEERQRQEQDRLASKLMVAESIIAAVRLACDDISKPSPRLACVVA
jgi:hypothetical protein